MRWEPVLHLASGVAFGVDVGDLLELEGAFEGDGVVDAAAEEEEVMSAVWKRRARVWQWPSIQRSISSSLAGILLSSVTRVEGLVVGDGAADLGDVERRAGRGRVSWAVKALVEATPISGPALVVMVPAALRVMAAPTTLQIANVFAPLAMSSFWAARVSAGFAGLGDEEAEVGGGGDGGRGSGTRWRSRRRRAGGQGRSIMNFPANGLRATRVPQASDGELGGGAELFGGDVQVFQEDVAGFEWRRDRVWCRGWRGAARWHFFEHEVLASTAFSRPGWGPRR